MKNIKFNDEYPSLIILGSTGSVGTQAADVAERLNIRVDALTAGSNSQQMEQQARLFTPVACAMADESAAKDLKIRLADTDIKVYSGSEGISELISETKSTFERQTVLNSISGGVGLKQTLATINAGKTLALANKESLVIAGDIVMKTANEKNIDILPVDSEHCAIFQCLRAGRQNEIKKILLTASGGPYFGYSKEQLSAVTVEQTLAHPTWKMGPKITVDSATLMNKGFEVIEAVHLFGVSAEQVQVVVQRQSIIHSMVEYIDNSVIAQMSVPDMRHCVQYALTHPNRKTAVTNELDLFKLASVTFDKPDIEAFPLLALAIESIKLGGAVPCVVNASNEVAVSAFLSGKIGFTTVFDIVITVTDALKSVASKRFTLDEIMECDSQARILANQIINTKFS